MQSPIIDQAVADVQAGKGNLQRIVIDARDASGEMYLHGAQVTQFCPRGHQPVLFISRDSMYRDDTPIRGGVPICWPWFGPKAGDSAAPMHGFARLMRWSLESIQRVNGSARVDCSLRSSDATRKHWPYDFAARFCVLFGADLDMSLTITNTDRSTFSYQEALHTYLFVGDVRQASISGLRGGRYFDKVNARDMLQQDASIRFSAETDRVYTGTQSSCAVDDPVLDRTITIAKSGSDATVVWNPWIDRAKSMSDFGDDEWQKMLCVETANAGKCAVTLQPGESHTIQAIVRVSKR